MPAGMNFVGPFQVPGFTVPTPNNQGGWERGRGRGKKKQQQKTTTKNNNKKQQPGFLTGFLACRGKLLILVMHRRNALLSTFQM